MVIRYDSAHRGLILCFLVFFFIFIITITYSFVERGLKVASAAVAHVVATCCSSYKILRSVYTLNGVSHAEVAKSRADPEPITRYSIRKSRH